MASSARLVLHYLDIGSLGRGEVIRLFLVDAGLPFQDIRYPYDDSWATTASKLLENGISRTGKVPVLEYNDNKLSQHIPILRYLSREMGDYDGQTSLDTYLVDAISDMYIDWRAQWVANRRKPTDDYQNEYVPNYYRVLSQYYSDCGGPFLLGDRITYADFVVFQSIDNDEKIGTLPKNLPTAMEKLIQAFESRPRVKEYLTNRRNTKV
ncbi:glutathione S-transferase [Penicillium daleae]|uniref:Glutathione S-transferase n=1 Tax=Penicillium daleae TaxID=63821 RepID=A0AAD6G2T9_9EURO|nr:glutathione S-transferase [Penicillium daleae]KAJ5449846.1 glutathione S-transferase [Penicillium daleae]